MTQSLAADAVKPAVIGGVQASQPQQIMFGANTTTSAIFHRAHDNLEAFVASDGSLKLWSESERKYVDYSYEQNKGSLWFLALSPCPPPTDFGGTWRGMLPVHGQQKVFIPELSAGRLNSLHTPEELHAATGKNSFKDHQAVHWLWHSERNLWECIHSYVDPGHHYVHFGSDGYQHIGRPPPLWDNLPHRAPIEVEQRTTSAYVGRNGRRYETQKGGQYVGYQGQGNKVHVDQWMNRSDATPFFRDDTHLWCHDGVQLHRCVPPQFEHRGKGQLIRMSGPWNSQVDNSTASASSSSAR